MSKRPSFQFYPADWIGNLSLRNCSYAAQGLWINMICLMHQGYPYGYLRIKGKVDSNGEMKGGEGLTSKRLAHILGADLRQINMLLNELEVNGVFERDWDGTIFSPRMVKDEKVRNIRALGGIKSILHPNTCKPKDKKERVPIKDTDKGYVDGLYTVPPPSSSTIKIKDNNINSPTPLIMELPDWLSNSDWENFVQHRKEMKAPLSNRAARMAISTLQELHAQGQDAEQVIRQTIVNGWKGLFAVKQTHHKQEQSSYVDQLKRAGAILDAAGSGSFLEIQGDLGGEMDKKHH